MCTSVSTHSCSTSTRHIESKFAVCIRLPFLIPPPRLLLFTRTILGSRILSAPQQRSHLPFCLCFCLSCFIYSTSAFLCFVLLFLLPIFAGFGLDAHFLDGPSPFALVEPSERVTRPSISLSRPRPSPAALDPFPSSDLACRRCRCPLPALFVVLPGEPGSSPEYPRRRDRNATTNAVENKERRKQTSAGPRKKRKWRNRKGKRKKCESKDGSGIGQIAELLYGILGIGAHTDGHTGT